MKSTSPIPNGSAAFFVSRAHTGFLFLLFVDCVPFLTFPHYTIIPSDTIIDFLRFFHPILSFHPILLLIFVDLSTLYHYFALYYYSGLQSMKFAVIHLGQNHRNTVHCSTFCTKTFCSPESKLCINFSIRKFA